MAKSTCKLERNMRIYKAHKKGVSYASISRLTNLTPQRVYQIVAFTEHMLNINEPDYINAYNNLGD